AAVDAVHVGRQQDHAVRVVPDDVGADLVGRDDARVLGRRSGRLVGRDRERGELIDADVRHGVPPLEIGTFGEDVGYRTGELAGPGRGSMSGRGVVLGVALLIVSGGCGTATPTPPGAAGSRCATSSGTVCGLRATAPLDSKCTCETVSGRQTGKVLP